MNNAINNATLRKFLLFKILRKHSMAYSPEREIRKIMSGKRTQMGATIEVSLNTGQSPLMMGSVMATRAWILKRPSYLNPIGITVRRN